jgi:probable blue pigment (indigoidine) exporter
LSHTTRFILSGLLFSILWASASVAGKFGLLSAEPLTLFTVRFIVAGSLLLVFAMITSRHLAPTGKEWWQLAVFGAFNTALYLGIFIIALRDIAAGITALAIALNPLMISILSSLWLKRPISILEWISIAVGIAGVTVATYPLLLSGHATTTGMILLGLSMLAYSIGAVYYSSVKWNLSRSVINGWQVFMGGLMLLPFTLFFEAGDTAFDTGFWWSIAWLVVPVSIVAVQLWLYLLKEDAVRASLWLFLCPIFGLAYSTWLLDEPFTLYTLAGTCLVLVSLYVGQRSRQAPKVA